MLIITVVLFSDLSKTVEEGRLEDPWNGYSREKVMFVESQTSSPIRGSRPKQMFFYRVQDENFQASRAPRYGGPPWRESRTFFFLLFFPFFYGGGIHLWVGLSVCQ